MRLLRDIEGLILVLLTWLLFFFTHRVTVSYVLLPLFGTADGAISPSGISLTKTGSIAYRLFCTAVILAVLAHARAVFSDPGRLTVALVTPPSHVTAPRLCRLCGGRWKPPRAHHCRKCNSCVFRMDHHCPWINNCVGLLNQKFFILFLIYTALACGFNLLLLAAAGFTWILFGAQMGFQVTFKSILLLIADVVVSCFFLFMALEFLSEQCEALVSNSTLVESYQNVHGIKRGTLTHMRQVMGDDFLFYPFPTQPRISVNFAEPVISYRESASRIRKRLSREKERAQKVYPKRRIAATRFKATSSSDESSTRSVGPNRKKGSYNSRFSCCNLPPSADGGDSIEDSRAVKTHVPRSVDSLSRCFGTTNIDSMNMVSMYGRPTDEIGEASDGSNTITDGSSIDGSSSNGDLGSPGHVVETADVARVAQGGEAVIDIPWKSMYIWEGGKMTFKTATSLTVQPPYHS